MLDIEYCYTHIFRIINQFRILQHKMHLKETLLKNEPPGYSSCNSRQHNREVGVYNPTTLRGNPNEPDIMLLNCFRFMIGLTPIANSKIPGIVVTIR